MGALASSVVVDTVVKATLLLFVALTVARLLGGQSASLRSLVVTTALGAVLLLPVLALVVPRMVVPILPPAPPSTASGQADANRAALTDALATARGKEPSVLWLAADERPAVAAALASARGREPSAVVLDPAAVDRLRVSTADEAPVEEMGSGGSGSIDRPDGSGAMLVVPARPGGPSPMTSARAAAPTDPIGFWERIGGLSWPSLLFIAWLLGAAIVAARLIRGAIELRRLRRSCDVVEDPDWLASMRAAVDRLGVGRPVALLCSDRIAVPVTFGVVYPVIVIPVAASEWAASRRAAVLDHELAHIARLDALTQWLGNVASVIYWFHPLVWLALRQGRTLRERACDDHVLNAGARASDYARDLLDIASTLEPRGYGAAALAMARSSQLEGRVVAVLDAARDRRRVSRRAGMVVAAAALLALVPLAALEVGCAAAPPASASPAATAEPAMPPPAPESARLDPVDPADGPGIAEGEDEPRSFSPPAPPDPPAPPEAAPARAARPSTPSTPSMPSMPTTARVPTTPRTPTAPTAPATPSLGPAVPAAPSAPATPARFSRDSSSGVGPWSSDCGGGRTGSQVSIQDEDGRKTIRASWSNSRCTVELKGEGEIVFRPDMSGVERLSSGGFLEVSQRTEQSLRVVRVTAPGGRLQETYRVDGQVRPLDPAARRWLGGLLLAIERRSGLAAKTRVAYLLRHRRGVDAVLDEVGHLAGDHVRSIYFLLLLGSARLDDGQLERTIRLAGQRIESDHELGRVLMEIAGRHPLAGPSSRRAFLAAAASIESDHERARVLLAIAAANLIDASTQPAYISLIGGMSSDHEKGRVVMDLLERGKPSSAATRGALTIAAGIGSDHEKGRVLVAVAERGPLPPAQRALYFRAAASIGSDHERARALLATVERARVAEATALAVLGSTAGMQSDHDKARVLVGVASKMPVTAATRRAYDTAARAIRSEHERTRVQAALP